MKRPWRWPLSLNSLRSRWPRDGRLFAAIFAFVTAVFVLFGLLVWWQDRASIISRQYSHLHSVGLDQVKELTVWERERSQTVERVAQNPFYRDSIVGLLEGSEPGSGRVAFEEDARELVRRPQYEAVFLLDARGLLRFGRGTVHFPAALVRLAAEARHGTEPRFFAVGSGATVRIVLLTQVRDHRGRFAGFFGAELIPDLDFGQFMSGGIPFGVKLAGIPVGRSRAEVLLVSDDGTVVAPRAAEHPRVAFGPRMPLGDGFFAATDEQGRRMVAEALPVPGTDWNVVTRLDARGFHAQLAALDFWALALLLIFLATTSTLTWLVWKWMNARRRLAESTAQRELAQLEQRFDYLAKYANDAILLTDDDYRILEVNDKAVELYGYSRDEFRMLDLAQLRAPQAAKEFERDWGEIRGRPSIVFETVHRTRGERDFPAEVSARAIPIDGRHQVQAIIRDISERKRAEAQSRRQANLYAALSRANEALTRFTSEARLLPEVCRIVSEVGGFAEVCIAMAEEGTVRITAHCGGLGTGDESGATLGDVAPEPLLTAFRTGRPEYVNDYVTDRRTAAQLRAAARGIASAAAFPLRRFERVVGVLGVASLEPNVFDDALLRLLQDMALDVSLGLENIEREQRRLISERLVRDSELRYRSLFENMGDGVVVMVRDPSDGFLVKEINSSFEKMEKAARRDMVGRRVIDALLWASHCLEPVAEEVWRTGEPRIIGAHVHPGKHAGWRESYVYRLPTDELVVVIADVSERLEAMDKCRHSEERLALVLEGTNEAYWDFDFESGKAWYSRRFAEMFGYGLDELGGSFDSWQKLVHPDDLVEVQRQLADHLSGKSDQFTSEHRMRHRERGYLWVRARGRVVRRAADGRPLRMSGTHADITAERQRDERLREWAVVFEQSREAIIITDGERRIISVNRAFSDVTGYRPEEVLGRDPRMLSSGVHDRAFYQTLWNSIEQTGHWQGEIQDRRKGGEIFPLWLAITAARDAAGRVQNYVAIASDISGQKEAEERIQHLAFHDALTGLPNRALFSDRLSFALAHARRHAHRVAVLFLDLDRFKAVNDTHGYAAGDRLLVQVAERLRSGLRRADTVARQGGDEFLVLFAELEQAEDAMFGARKMVEELARPYPMDGFTAAVTASIGIALYPGDGEDADTLLRHADAALYHAKERGRNNFQFYDEELNRRADSRLSLESRLRHAIDAGDFVLHYQPQVALDTGQPVRAEALVRMRSDGALLEPAEFLPVARETGLVVPLGEWVLREACRQQQAWQAAGLPRLPVAINVSAGELHERSWLERLREVVGTCADRGAIELEFDERTLQAVAGNPALLQALKELGVALALDNFGGSDSSLGTLRRFPVEHLKLDRTLVHDAATAEAIVALARGLGIRVVAQGVERAEELRQAREQHCDEVQGRYLAPPLDAEEFAVWWSSRSGAP